MPRPKLHKPVVYVDTATLYEKMESTNMDYVFRDLKHYLVVIEEHFVRLLPITQKRVRQQRATVIEGLDEADLPIVIVQCLGILTTATKQYRLIEINAELIQNRDSFFRSVKTIVINFRRAKVTRILHFSLFLIQYIIYLLDRESVQVQQEAAISMLSLFNKFGHILRQQQFYIIMSKLSARLIAEADSVQVAARRIYTGMARCCNNRFYAMLVADLEDGLEVFGADYDTEAYIKCIAEVCEETPYRFAKYFENFFSTLYDYAVQGSESMLECCLNIFATFAEFCPRQITEHIPKIVNLSLANLSYESDENFDTDDSNNMTWRMRRAAARCLRMIISSHHELVVKFYIIVTPAVIEQFEATEDSVKVEAVQTYTELIKSTKLSVSKLFREAKHLLEEQVPVIIEEIIKIIEKGKVDTCQAGFYLLKSLCATLPGALTHHMVELMPVIHHSLDEENSSSHVIADALLFLHDLLTSHPAVIFHPYINSLLPLVQRAVKTDLVIHSRGLSVLEELVKIIGPLRTSEDFNCEQFVHEIYELTLLKLNTYQTCIKYQQQVILTMGQVIANFGHYLPEHPTLAITKFMQYLNKPDSCSSTIRALTTIVSSRTFIDTHLINEIFAILCTLILTTTGKTQSSTIQLLNNLVKKYGLNINFHSMQVLVIKLLKIFNESNLPLVELIMETLETVTRLKEQLVLAFAASVLNKAMILLKSTSTKGSILDSISKLLECLVSCGVLHRSKFLKSVGEFIPTTGGELKPAQKDILYAAAKCTAPIITLDKKKVALEVAKLIRNTKDSTNVAEQFFNLNIVAEIGLKFDTSNEKKSILQFILTPPEDIGIAAGRALGTALQWNLGESLPYLLQKIRNHPNQHPLIGSLKAIITSASSTPGGIQKLFVFMPEIWEQLLMRSAFFEGESQEVLAECLGRLILIDHKKLFDLKAFLHDLSPHRRALAIMAVRHTILAEPHDIDRLLSQHLLQFLEGLTHSEVNAQRAAAMLFYTIMEVKPHLIEHILDTVVPYVYCLTEEHEAIMEIENTEVRKIAFESMLPLLHTCFYKINIFTLLDLLKESLQDHTDIRMACHTILSELTLWCPLTIIAEMDDFLPSLYAICIMPIERGMSRQDLVIRSKLQTSAMQTIHAFSAISNPDKNSNINKLVKFIKESDTLAPLFETVRQQICARHAQ